MASNYKNKTLTTLLALTFGGIGLHRFYLKGFQDRWGLLHLATVPLSLGLMSAGKDWPVIFTASPLILSVLVGFLEALVLGLIPDDQWDARYNSGTGRESRSGWPLAVILVLTLGIGSTALIATLARSFDILFTGGSFG